MDDTLYIETLRRYFGYDSFRSIQLDIVRSIANGHDTLGLMPTGGGKSITFQVPALTMEGVCIVITPLVSLMKDQVAHLKARGIQAEMVYSGLGQRDIQRIFDNAIYGGVKFLYISPERIGTPLFQQKVQYMKVCFITIDEAHCISQWGYDFRPSYLKINEIRQLLPPETPVLALTATATPIVVEDIQRQLHFGETTPNRAPRFYKMSFMRDNLFYVVRQTLDKEKEIIHILKSFPGCAIIFTTNRKKTKELAKYLTDNGITATYYHAGLDIAIKDQRQHLWQTDKVRVMVATNAFGMGIDKPDVRLVIHYSSPDSLEAYFQEAGRGGRDGKTSYAVLLTNSSTPASLQRKAECAFPPKDYIRQVYDHLAFYFELAVESGQGARYQFSEENFCIKFRHYPMRLEGALKMLQRVGYLRLEEDSMPLSRIKFLLSRNELYNVQNLSPNEQTIFDYILRTQTGVFTDFCYFDEAHVSDLLDIDRHHLYVALKSLGQKGIWLYVPASSTPTIYYPMQRIPSSRLCFPKEMYEDLQARLADRIASIINYQTSTTVCRSKLLLDYFGESNSPDCGHCDVCQAKKVKARDTKELVRQKLKQLLGDGKEHHLDEIKQWDEWHTSPDVIKKMLMDDVSNGKIKLTGVLIKRNR